MSTVTCTNRRGRLVYMTYFSRKYEIISMFTRKYFDSTNCILFTTNNVNFTSKMVYFNYSIIHELEIYFIINISRQPQKLRSFFLSQLLFFLHPSSCVSLYKKRKPLLRATHCVLKRHQWLKRHRGV